MFMMVTKYLFCPPPPTFSKKMTTILIYDRVKIDNCDVINIEKLSQLAIQVKTTAVEFLIK